VPLIAIARPAADSCPAVILAGAWAAAASHAQTDISGAAILGDSL
jgi:hypothetical protein